MDCANRKGRWSSYLTSSPRVVGSMSCSAIWQRKSQADAIVSVAPVDHQTTVRTFFPRVRRRAGRWRVMTMSRRKAAHHLRSDLERFARNQRRSRCRCRADPSNERPAESCRCQRMGPVRSRPLQITNLPATACGLLPESKDGRWPAYRGAEPLAPT